MLHRGKKIFAYSNFIDKWNTGWLVGQIQHQKIEGHTGIDLNHQFKTLAVIAAILHMIKWKWNYWDFQYIILTF